MRIVKWNAAASLLARGLFSLVCVATANAGDNEAPGVVRVTDQPAASRTVQTPQTNARGEDVVRGGRTYQSNCDNSVHVGEEYVEFWDESRGKLNSWCDKVACELDCSCHHPYCQDGCSHGCGWGCGHRCGDRCPNCGEGCEGCGGKSGWRCKCGYFIRTGCCGAGCPPIDAYHIAYATNPEYFDGRDARIYAAQGYGVPMAVPLAPNVAHTYNYGWGIPSSRLTPISRFYPEYGYRINP